MNSDVSTHPTTIELKEMPPTSIAVDERFTVTANVRCPDGCDLRGLHVTVTAPDGAVTKGELADCHDGVSETAAIALKAPRHTGVETWTIAFDHERDGVCHAASALSFSVKIEPHATSLAVWDIPSPVVIGTPFAIKVGAKSTSGCTLKGKRIEVCDAAGTILASGEFGETPWEGTSALYWTEVTLPPPAAAGVLKWSARFAGTDLELPHEGTSSSFSFAAVRAPECTVTVKVIDNKTAQPVEDVQVLLGPYRAATGASGCADLKVPKDAYELAIWKVNYEAEPRTLSVDADATVEVAATFVPEPDPDALWQM